MGKGISRRGLEVRKPLGKQITKDSTWISQHFKDSVGISREVGTNSCRSALPECLDLVLKAQGSLRSMTWSHLHSSSCAGDGIEKGKNGDREPFVWVPHILFIHVWVDIHFCFFSPFDSCEEHCYKHSCSSVCLIAFKSFEYISRSGITGSYGDSIFNFFEEPGSSFCFVLKNNRRYLSKLMAEGKSIGKRRLKALEKGGLLRIRDLGAGGAEQEHGEVGLSKALGRSPSETGREVRMNVESEAL